MKLRLMILAFYLAFRIFRSWSRPDGLPRQGGVQPRGQIDDVMVKDPVCEVYIPQKEGIRLRADGKDFYFCSPACRDRFLEARREKPS